MKNDIKEKLGLFIFFFYYGFELRVDGKENVQSLIFNLYYVIVYINYMNMKG